MVDPKQMLSLAEKAAADVAPCDPCASTREIWSDETAGFIPCPDCRPAPLGESAGYRISLDPEALETSPPELAFERIEEGRTFDRLPARLRHVFGRAVSRFHAIEPEATDVTAYLERYSDAEIARMAREYAGRYERSDRADVFRDGVYLRAIALALSEFQHSPDGVAAVMRMVATIASLPPFKPIHYTAAP